ESKGERQIRLFLEDNDIKYVYQKKFKNCKSTNLLPFDFYLPEYNMCIEYDGEQHFKPFRFEKDDLKLKKRMNNDDIKNNFCENNNINLYRIKYNDDIYDKLNKLIKMIKNEYKTLIYNKKEK
ncbi:MAG: hypothetical protein ACOCVF_03750, partial [bacterium]